jgi:hypothetical protein
LHVAFHVGFRTERIDAPATITAERLLLLRLTLRLDYRNYLVAAVTLLPGEVQEFADAYEHGTLLRSSDHSHTATSGEIQQTFIAQDVQRSYDRVLIHAQYVGQVNSWREAFTRGSLTVGNRSAYLGGHLTVERVRPVLIDLWSSHSTISHSTIFF